MLIEKQRAVIKSHCLITSAGNGGCMRKTDEDEGVSPEQPMNKLKGNCSYQF